MELCRATELAYDMLLYCTVITVLLMTMQALDTIGVQNRASSRVYFGIQQAPDFRAQAPLCSFSN